MIKRITIDGLAIEDIPSFYNEINRVFMQSETWQISNSLDALDDLLYGGFGAIRNTESVELEWLNFEKSRQALGYDVTKAYYIEKLKPESPYNKALFREKLEALQAGTGETYFDIILSIIADHSNINIIAR